jgi:hypothetical protein
VSNLFRDMSEEHADQRQDCTRFIHQWDSAHAADAEFDATFPRNHVELPSPYMNGFPEPASPHINGLAELPAPEWPGSLPSVPEPVDDVDSNRFR